MTTKLTPFEAAQNLQTACEADIRNAATDARCGRAKSTSMSIKTYSVRVVDGDSNTSADPWDVDTLTNDDDELRGYSPRTVLDRAERWVRREARRVGNYAFGDEITAFVYDDDDIGTNCRTIRI